MSKIADCPICGLCPGYDRKAGVTKFIGCCGHAVQFADDVEKQWKYAAAMKAETRHNALVEAVAWERECEDFDPFRPVPSGSAASWLSRNSESWNSKHAARAEVDRLIATDDCRGEG